MISLDKFHPLVLGIILFMVTLFMFAPRLQVFTTPADGTFEWSRGISFAQQTEAPFEQPREIAMRWRSFPAMICWATGLRGYKSFLFPWIGLTVLLIYCWKTLQRYIPSTPHICAGYLLVCASSAILVPVHWLGIIDPWYLLGLMLVAFSPQKKWLAAAILIFPLFDERFIIGLPLAFVVRYLSLKDKSKLHPTYALLLLPYIALRLYLSPTNSESDEAQFIVGHFHAAVDHLPYIPLGWWMGYRIGWIFILAGIWFAYRAHGQLLFLLLFGGIACTAITTTLLAWDISRSIAILLPTLVYGFIQVVNHDRWKQDPLPICLISAFVLLIPALHVVGHKLHPIETFPVEILRWLT